MTTRRQWMQHTSVLLTAALLPTDLLAESDISIFRTIANPGTRHFSVDDARHCIRRHRENRTLDDRCLDLTEFSTLSKEALRQLEDYEWVLANYGIVSLTHDLAESIARIPVGHSTFHHASHVSLEGALDLLAAGLDISFDHVIGIQANRLKRPLNLRCTGGRSGSISINGDYAVDEKSAQFLLELPGDIHLSPVRKKSAVSSRAWTVLSNAIGKKMDVSTSCWDDGSEEFCLCLLQDSA